MSLQSAARGNNAKSISNIPELIIILLFHALIVWCAVNLMDNCLKYEIREQSPNSSWVR